MVSSSGIDLRMAVSIASCEGPAAFTVVEMIDPTYSRHTNASFLFFMVVDSCLDPLAGVYRYHQYRGWHSVMGLQM